MRRIALFTFFAILSFSISCFAQQKGKWGLSISNANTIGAAYFLEDKMRLSAELGFRSNSSGGSADLSIGVGLWYYLAKVDHMDTFVGGGIGVGSDPGGGQSTGSVSIIGQYGVEYWVSSRIGVHGYIGLGYGSSGPSGSKTSALSTISGVGLTWLLN